MLQGIYQRLQMSFRIFYFRNDNESRQDVPEAAGITTSEHASTRELCGHRGVMVAPDHTARLPRNIP